MAMDQVNDGGNWYKYVYGNPIVYMDPNGLWAAGIGVDYGATAIGRVSTGKQIVFDGCGNLGTYEYVSFGAGLALPSYGASVTVSISFNAKDIYDLAGISGGVGGAFNGTFLGFPGSIGIDASFGSMDGRRITQYMFVVSAKMDLPIDMHGTDTIAVVRSGFNVPDEVQKIMEEVKQFGVNISEFINDVRADIHNVFSIFKKYLGC